MINKSLLIALVALVSAQAQAYLLSNWNVNELDASGDFIELNVLTTDGGNTFLEVKWYENDTTDSSPVALGIDMLYYNCADCTFSHAPGDDSASYAGLVGVTVDDPAGDMRNWFGNFGGVTAGGGFGKFASQANTDGGGTDGILNTLYFELLGDVAFAANAQGATFAAHVRYDDGCSGWVSDGRGGDSVSSSSCGKTEVPEPGSLALLAIGIAGLVVGRRNIR